MVEKNDILIVDEESFKDRIYLIRGEQVMISYDLAEIYGYEHKRFMEQVKNNIEKFDDDFMFQMSWDEYDNLKSKKSASSWGGRRKPPYAFTESGLYMLMTVLRGDLATRQSKALIRLFKGMKDYIIEYNRLMIKSPEYKDIFETVNVHSSEIKEIKELMVTKAELSDFMRLFDSGNEQEEVLILDGEPFKADIAYQRIYGKAKRKLVIIDDYISAKTLQHLAHAKANVAVNVISDNKGGKPLRLTEFQDFTAEYPGRSVTFTQTMGRVHDRYIVLDHGMKDMRVYHCGASSKDAGKRITTITGLNDVSGYGTMVSGLLGNPGLVLR